MSKDDEDWFFLMKLLSVAGQSVILMTGGSEAAAAMFTLFYIIPQIHHLPFPSYSGTQHTRGGFQKVILNICPFFTFFWGFHPVATKSGSAAETNDSEPDIKLVEYAVPSPLTQKSTPLLLIQLWSPVVEIVQTNRLYFIA